jgi:diguanylate cyclase (GGDEF)-like protein
MSVVSGSSLLSRTNLGLIALTSLAVGLCTLTAGLVAARPPADATAHSPLVIELVALSVGFAWIIAGLSLRGVRKRAAALDAVERTLREKARLDPLTQVLTRSAFLTALTEQMALARQGEPLALFALDLDRFKEANDTHGHAMGDAVLRHIGAVLEWELDGAVIGRLGGDEFAFILPGFGSRTVCERIGNRVLGALGLPTRLCSVVVQISGSIGVAWTPEHSLDADELMRFADLALYRAKANGRRTVECFDPGLVARQQRHQTIERALAAALAAGHQLDVHFQPIVAHGGASPVGAEALLRWRHPEQGFIPPGEFIPVAESMGLIDKLGQLVFDRAFEAAKAWPALVLNVNVSPAQLRNRSFTAALLDKLAVTGFPPGRLVLEITEGVLLECGPDQIAQLNELRAAGVRIALDDFGSGYSSLAYVRDFPLDQIKIDRSYISSLPDDPRSGVVVGAICELGRGLELLVVAEGVETEEQLILVKAAGCTHFQGFHFARPMPAADFSGYLDDAARRDPAQRDRVLRSVA